MTDKPEDQFLKRAYGIFYHPTAPECIYTIVTMVSLCFKEIYILVVLGKSVYTIDEMI